MANFILKNSFLILIPIFFVTCIKSPQYPAVPQIDFVESQKYTLGFGIDSIHIKLKFKDGDGDLGLNDTDYPTQEYTLGDTVRNLPYDKWDCNKYLSINGDRDTVTITRFPNYFNFFVNFYKKNSNGTYDTIVRPDCQQNNGRFSRFDPDPNYSGPLEGTIEWNFKGSFSEEFKGLTVQIGIYIQDRAFHKSNEIRTPDIQF